MDSWPAPSLMASESETVEVESPSLLQNDDVLLCSTPIAGENTNRRTARTLASAKRKRITSAERASKTSKAAKMAKESNDDLFRKMTGYMDTKFDGVNGKLEDNSSKLEVVTSSVATLTEKVTANSAEITVMKRQILDLQSGSAAEKRVEELVRNSLSRQSANPENISKEVRRVEQEVEKIKSVQGLRQGDRKDSSQEERHYWWSRRAVRIWPITASSNQDLWKATGDYFFKVLEIPESALSEDSVESIRKVFQARNRGKQPSRIQNEVRVLFKDVETRDMIYSYAPNLANKRDKAGMRLEVPSHLLGHFKTLERYGRLLKSRHPLLRWHIKYDDPELSMFLNVKLSDEERWSKIDFATARSETRKEDSDIATSFRERLGSSQSSQGSIEDNTGVEAMDASSQASSLPISSTLEKFSKPTPRWGERK